MNNFNAASKAHTDYFIESAERAIIDNDLCEAERRYYAALSLTPSNTPLLKQIGTLYERQQRREEASLCYRGVIPDGANSRYFEADRWADTVIPIAESTTTTVLNGFAAETFLLPPPVRFGEEGIYNQFNRKRTEAAPAQTAVLENGEIWFDGVNTLVFDADRRLPDELIKGNEYLARQAACRSHPTRLHGVACFLDGRSASIYYHWMLDILPKLGLLERGGLRLTDIDHFIVRAEDGFQRDTLRHLGVPENRIVNSKGFQHYRADQLVVPLLKNDLGHRIYTALGLGMGRWVPEFLRDKFLPQSNVTAPPTRAVFISRGKTGSRSIENIDPFREVIAGHGIEECALETLPVTEQAELMSGCWLVLGVHGAGLTNTLFCPPGASVLELFGDYVVPCYWSLTNLSGLKYHQFMAASNQPNTLLFQEKTVGQRRAGKIRINCSALDNALNEIRADRSLAR